MKKLITIIAFLFASNLVIAQQSYYTFTIKNKSGITDANGNEVIKPIHSSIKFINAKNQIYLKNYGDRPDVIFNTKSGTSQSYEYITDGAIKIKEIPYSLIENKGKDFFISEESDKIINAPADYNRYKNVGSYIFAQYYYSGNNKSYKDKNGIIMPPKVEKPRECYAVFTNDETLKLMLKSTADKYLPLVKIGTKANKDEPPMVEVVLVDINFTPKFDYIIFSDGNKHSLYNAKMALVKSFILANADNDMLIEASEKIVKVNLVKRYTSSDNPPVMIGPSGPGYSSGEKPKINYPFFYTKKLENGNTLFAKQESEEISNHIFEIKPESTLTYKKSDNSITIRGNGNERSSFYINPNTGMPYLPKAYLAILGITII